MLDDINEKDLTFVDDKGYEQTDRLNRIDLLESFCHTVTESTFSVYALTGSWGSGKTTFIKMFINIMKRQKKHIVYIDSYANDYQTDPFSMIVKGFAEYLRKDDSKIDGTAKKEFFEKAKSVAFKTGKIGVKLATSLLLNKFLGLDDSKEIKELIHTLGSDFVDDFDYEKDDKENVFEQFKAAAKKLLASCEEVTIIIDELDRCRPDFAMETIEKIKHIFNVPKLKFILVYNKSVLHGIIDRMYGAGDDSDLYMSKLVEKEFVLPVSTNELEKWLDYELDALSQSGVNSRVIEMYKNKKSFVVKAMRDLAISLRNMSRIIVNTQPVNTIEPETNETKKQFQKNCSLEIIRQIFMHEKKTLFDQIKHEAMIEDVKFKRNIQNSEWNYFYKLYNTFGCNGMYGDINSILHDIVLMES